MCNDNHDGSGTNKLFYYEMKPRRIKLEILELCQCEGFYHLLETMTLKYTTMYLKIWRKNVVTFECMYFHFCASFHYTYSSSGGNVTQFHAIINQPLVLYL